jgi:hypothetical protein
MAEARDWLVGSSAAEIAEYIVSGEEAVTRYVCNLEMHRRWEAE